jgi:ferredoxin
MSAESFAERLPYNTPGKFYVDEQCLDCDLCRETAPTVFARNDEEGTSYVVKQPETKAEIDLTREAMEGCPFEAIFDDGDQHDWAQEPKAERPAWRTDDAEKPICSHCKQRSRPWWKFWA